MRILRINRVLIAVMILGSGLSTALAQTPFRFEAEAGAGTLRVPGTDRTGWAVRHQLTAYVRPRVGVSVGLTWGGSANTDPLDTRTTPNPFGRPDPAKLNQFYVRADRMADLSMVFLPVLTRRHQLTVRAGASVYHSNATRVDRVIFYQPGNGDYQTVLSQTSTSRVAPLVGVSYEYRLSNRWAMGLQGTAYFTSQSQPTTTVGLRTTYRFNLGADSLGIKSIDRNELRAGVRLAGNLTSENERSSADVYRLRSVAGLWAELPLSLTWQIRGEINYAQRGYQTRDVGQGGHSRFGNLNYLEIPLLFRNEVAYHWHLYGGPYLAFFLNGRAESDGKPEPVQPYTASGLLLGADYQFSDRLSLDVRYQRDVLRLSSSPYGGLHGFQLGLNYTINGKP